MSAIRKSSIYALLGFAIPTLLVLISQPILLSKLGLEAYGIFTLIASLTGSFAFLDMGLSAATLKCVAEDIGHRKLESLSEILSGSVIFYGGLGLVLFIGFWISSSWITQKLITDAAYYQETVSAIRLSAIQLALVFLMNVFLSLLKGMHRFDLSTLSITAFSLISNGSIIIAVLKYNPNIAELAAINVGVTFFALICAASLSIYLCISADLRVRVVVPTIAVYRRLFVFGFPLTVTMIINILNSHVRLILLGAVLGPQSVAVFNLGTFPAAKANSATMALSEPLFPKVAAASSSDKTYLGMLYKKYLLVVLSISAILLAPFILFPDFIYSLWLNHEVPPNVTEIAAIFSVALFVNAASQPAQQFVNGMGQQKVNTLYAAINATTAYTILAVLYATKDTVTVIDFAIAASGGLIITGVGYLLWYRRNFNMV